MPNVQPQLDLTEHDPILDAKRVTDAPFNSQVRMDYAGRSDGQPVYVGIADRGALTSDSPKWVLYKLTYSSGDVTVKQTAYGSWDNRTSETYA